MTSPIIYLPHGGGPLPLFGETNHKALIQFMQQLAENLTAPKSILVVSAHWEEQIPTVSSHATPPMFYDYYGFPPESYQIEYPAPGNPALAQEIVNKLNALGVTAKQDDQRGFDHGTFVPLKLMFPEANIPVVQLSLNSDLKPESQIRLGECIAELANQEVLIIGSGLSFHNLNVLMSNDPEILHKSTQFDDWLNHTVLSQELDWQQKQSLLIDWLSAPHARFAHPREEHLLPLHVCFGAAKKLDFNSENIFNQVFLNTKISGFMWQSA